MLPAEYLKGFFTIETRRSLYSKLKKIVIVQDVTMQIVVCIKYTINCECNQELIYEIFTISIIFHYIIYIIYKNQ